MRTQHLDWLLLFVGIAGAIGVAAHKNVPSEMWSAICYDLGIGAVLSIFIYWLVVRVPQSAKQTRMRRLLLRRYRELKQECVIQLLFASGSASVSVELWDRLLDPRAFREYFYADKRRRWYLAMNAVDYGEGLHFENLKHAVSTFRSELDFALSLIDCDDDTFNALKRVATQFGNVLRVKQGAGEVDRLFGALQLIAGGWTGNGTVDYDPIDRLINKIV